MKTRIETLSHWATLLASLFVIMLVGLQLKERWLAQPAHGAAPSNATERVTDLRVEIPREAVKGSEQAKVAFIEFSDFQCPFCGMHERETSPIIQKEFVDSGKVRYAFRNFPLTRIHPFAQNAGVAALCAAEQNKFWPMHDRLFNDQKMLDVPDLLRHAQDIHLNQYTFKECLDRGLSPALSLDIDEANRVGVTSTPTFLIGTVQPDGKILVLTKIHGAQPISVFRAALEEALKNSTRPGRT